MLPETKFNFFDFKTMIVNDKNKKDSVNFLFDNVDVDGYFQFIIDFLYGKLNMKNTLEKEKNFI